MKNMGFVLLIGCALFIIVEAWPLLLALFLLVAITGGIIGVIKNKQKEEQFNSIDLSEIDMMEGLEFEQYVAKLLEKNGYTNVSVTKASGDYGVDVVARYTGRQYAFQCKRYNGRLGVKPVQEVYSGAKMYHSEVPVVITNSYFTPNAEKLARELNVQLWDRDKLYQLIRHVPQKINTPTSEEINSNNNKPEVTFNMATVLGAGKYVFGKNIPKGTYDLFAVRGKGFITPFDLEGEEEEMIWFGLDAAGYAKEYRGLSSDDIKKFVVEGNVEFEIKRAQMITIEED